MDNTVAAISDALNKIQVRMAIPVEIDLWDAQSVGAYLKVEKEQVLARYAPLPDFPNAIRLPSPTGGRGRPRWKAREVVAWAEKYQEKRQTA